ncbi:ester cyclase [Puniceicoccaceae bacterium K14]|nr:ester cyclase [Puniceicoccaceae bacterium K14]
MSKVDLSKTLSQFMDSIWNSGNYDRVADYVSNAYTIRDDPGDPWNGKTLDHQNFIQRVQYSRNAFPDFNFDIQEVIEGEEKVAARWVMSGTHRGDLPMIPATGKPFRISGMTFYYFSNGKVSGHKQCFDQLGFIQQINAFETLFKNLSQ